MISSTYESWNVIRATNLWRGADYTTLQDLGNRLPRNQRTDWLNNPQWIQIIWVLVYTQVTSRCRVQNVILIKIFHLVSLLYWVLPTLSYKAPFWIISLTPHRYQPKQIIRLRFINGMRSMSTLDEDDILKFESLTRNKNDRYSHSKFK